ncbi:MAG: hypothetical protein PHZ25_02105 [Candidatus Pacebacteria bacterium]|nr:hypothetical protein [Candidatus Paceibacterota bacterium]
MNIFPILLILSDFTFFILRLSFGAFIFEKGLRKFSKTGYIGLVDLVSGFLIFFGFLFNFASFFITLELFILLAFKLVKKKYSKDEFLLDFLLFSIALFFFTKNAGILSLDESMFGLF